MGSSPAAGFFRGPFRPKSVDGRLLLDALQTFRATMSALPPKADIREGAAKRLLMTQAV